MKIMVDPNLSKGMLVRPIDKVNGWRRLTAEEKNAWYAKFHEDCRNGKEVWHDSAGEPVLAPCDTYYTLDPSMTLTVIRARASAPHGYGSSKGCCLVFCPDNGETLYVKRVHLTDKW